jgi:ribosome-associated protein
MLHNIVDDNDEQAPDPVKLLKEVTFQATRSSGKGGQHVNKVSTKVELSFNITESAVLSKAQKKLLLHKLKTKVSAEGILRIASQEGRSQMQNKSAVIEKFSRLVASSLKKRKKRIPTVPAEEYHTVRLEKKRKLSEKKALRKIQQPD